MTEEIAAVEIDSPEEANELLAPGEGTSLTKTLDNVVKTVTDQGFYSTFDTDNMEGKKKVFKATNAAFLLRDYVETPIACVDMVFSPSEVITEDGEAKTVLAGYLVDNEGNVYMSSSQGVIKSMVRMLDQFGHPSTWGEPVEVICRETNTNRGRRYKFLDIA